MFVIPALGREKEEDPWGSLARQASILVYPKTMRDIVSNGVQSVLEDDTLNYPPISTCVHTCEKKMTMTTTKQRNK